jgi:hypothetical protein
MAKPSTLTTSSRGTPSTVSPVPIPCLPPPPLLLLLNPPWEGAALYSVRRLRLPTDDYSWEEVRVSFLVLVVGEEEEEGEEEAWLQVWRQQLLGWLGRRVEGQQEHQKHRWIREVWNMYDRGC